MGCGACRVWKGLCLGRKTHTLSPMFVHMFVCFHHEHFALCVPMCGVQGCEGRFGGCYGLSVVNSLSLCALEPDSLTSIVDHAHFSLVQTRNSCHCAWLMRWSLSVHPKNASRDHAPYRM